MGLLVIKDGELRKCGVGISVFRNIGESVVTFPSSLNKVQFSAQQVSNEMQGVEVSGFVIWVINRHDDSPYKAYRHIKNLSNLTPDSEVNANLKSMAESIVRSQIANLSIHEVVAEREKVRDRIRKTMQEVIGGWGIWLETVEITDVKILSGSLFNDLQQEFRSSTRQTAEKIRIDTESELSEKRLLTRFKTEKLRNEKEVETQIEKSKMKLRKEEQEQKVYEQVEEIKRSNLEMKNTTAILEQQMRLKMEEEKQRIAIAQKEHDLKMKELQNKFELKRIEERYAVDSKMSDINLKQKILQTVENIYKSMNVDSMKIVNFGQGQGLESGIGKMALALREIGNQLEDKK